VSNNKYKIKNYRTNKQHIRSDERTKRKKKY